MTALPSSGPSASVVLCCYSEARFADLCAAVLSIRPQLDPADEIVVVVDHNLRLMARIAERFPDLTVVENDGPRGLSGARNAGIRRACGSLLVFLDDDAEAEPSMLDRLKAGASQPDVLGVAARILPAWLGPEPGWFPPEFLWVLGCTYEGLAPGRVRNLIGAAMAVPRTVFEAVGGFESALGRTHARLPLGCEETELCIRAARACPTSHFTYIPEAACRHKVPPQRATLTYLMTRCYAEGLSKAHLAALAGRGHALASERAYVARILPRGVARGLYGFARRRDVDALRRAGTIVLGFACTVAGYLVGRARLGPRAPAADAAPVVFAAAIPVASVHDRADMRA